MLAEEVPIFPIAGKLPSGGLALMHADGDLADEVLALMLAAGDILPLGPRTRVYLVLCMMFEYIFGDSLSLSLFSSFTSSALSSLVLSSRATNEQCCPVT